MSLKTKRSLQANGTNKRFSKLTKSHYYMLSKVAKYLVEHQIAVIILAYILEVPGSEKFLFLRENPKTGHYEKSMDDTFFIFFWVVTFTLLRAVTMEYILVPIAKKGRIKKMTQRTRFAEQGWSFLYYSIFWTFGMYIMYHSPYWFDTTYFWKGYPHKELTYLLKSYYLLQLAFWLQQLFVVNIEKRRKDFVEMTTHHVVTISLMFFSYIFNFTRIGNAVLCTMDFADILLPLAKMLKYLRFNMFCDVLFGIFMVSWLVTRHYIYGHIIYSTWTEPLLYIEYKWVPEEDYYFTKNVQRFFLFLFCILQAIIIFWFCLISNVAYKVIKGDGAHDSRSSDSERLGMRILNQLHI
ncbi:2617_t:CDS:2 [Scutellospora calospora]|uniref:2617_t:CDS:1 n=1 Tax=Scutellospora calospora TaxID=85575 RepID=A0ACA9K580_9GLOM|nr:2617_t:CDS:2 [Scutellospora calospora]